MKIGERIFAERTKKGLDIECVAKALSVESSIVSKWESGEVVPTVSELCALAAFFQHHY